MPILYELMKIHEKIGFLLQQKNVLMVMALRPYLRLFLMNLS